MAVVSSRYARALIEALAQDNTPGPDAGFGQLEAIRAFLDAEPDALKLLINPVIPPARRDEFITDMGSALQLDSRVLRLLRLIVERRRLAILDEVIEAYRNMLDERSGIVRAVVTAASPLKQSEQQAISAKLELSLGQQVVMEVQEDPSLIGGLVVQIGSTVYDGSLLQGLKGFKEKLLAG